MRKPVIGIASLALAAVWALPLAAQDVTCDDISFDDRIMATYPQARDACLDIVESDGVRYAHFEALVHREGFPSMLLRFKNRDGTWGPATLVSIPAGFTVYLEGQPVAAKDVPRGRQLDFYMPEGRWEVAVSGTEDVDVAEADFAPIEFDVVEMELPEEVDMDAPAMSQEEMAAAAMAEDAMAEDAMAEADEGMQDEGAAMDQADQDDGQPVDAPDQSEWYWILGLAAAFIIVWFLLRRRKARREG
jgi:hypothetical protein